MLQVGQIRKSNTDYLTPLSIKAADIYTKGVALNDDANNIVFKDFGLDLGENGFQSDTTYYLRFSVRRYPEDPSGRQYGDYDTVNFSLILCKKTGYPDGDHGSNERLQTIERNLVITPYIQDENGEGLNSPWQQFTIVFTPVESARYLWFRVSRIGYDYVYASEVDPSRMGRAVFQYYGTPLDSANTIEFSNGPRNVDIEIGVNAELTYYDRVRNALSQEERPRIMSIVDDAFRDRTDRSKKDIGLYWLGNKEIKHKTINVTGEFAKVIDQLPRKVNQIGIQSRPGSLFIVNHEPIYLGRSGVYEVNNGTIIDYIGVVAPDGSRDITNIQDFIIDYAYIVEEG